ncbi:hypothetical protein E2C01_098868 [Portunus trituberculatus]|uniref:Uncharacterized protein n=1 Tax=Portunus trituberculatus TaxID=210409 RepID=A0A5B7K414_PORTR|nr:hypothetical protein [Portunus trituberculatus]
MNMKTRHGAEEELRASPLRPPPLTKTPTTSTIRPHLHTRPSQPCHYLVGGCGCVGVLVGVCDGCGWVWA